MRKGYKLKILFNDELKNCYKGEKIGVVTHFNTIASLTAEGYDPKHLMRIKDYVSAKNCQNVPLNDY